MIERPCEACEHRFEARIAELEKERDAAMSEVKEWVLSGNEVISDGRAAAPTRAQVVSHAHGLRETILDLEIERDAAIARAAEERAARSGLEEQLAEAERRRDELRAQVARMEAERDRLHEGIKDALDLIAAILAGGWSRDGHGMLLRLRALLCEAKEGGGA